jgi:hypothetical protein
MRMKRAWVVFACALFIFPFTLIAQDQLHDSYYVEGGGEPEFVPPEEEPEIELPPAPSGGGGGGGSGGGGAGGGSNGPGVPESPDDVIETLINSGAASGAGIAAGNETSARARVSVSGSKVREILRASSDVGQVLDYWKGLKGKRNQPGRESGKMTPGEYYSLVAATLAGEDGRLDEAAFEAGRFEITYRSRGALLWLIPFSFPVRVTVTPLAAENARTKVALPWYHWFVNEYFTRDSLAGEIEAVLKVQLARPELAEAAEEEVNADLFAAVAEFLRGKVRTITNSVISGS